ncbi:hypothetical protein OPV22_030867 [Ensete ventricosum]|uniref:K Homology domain-containing protein n=1 Tax=Ensete ventricosum TaxID=4639 RepID=A0AAV8P0U3_ENSVE|nr:hypothetical protein OPV22_030867 [Ensete ventricosum]
MKDNFDQVNYRRRERKQKFPHRSLPPRPPRGSSAPSSDVQRPSQTAASDYSGKLFGRAIMSQSGMITRSGLPSYAYPGMITKSGLPSHDYPGSTKRIEIPNELVVLIIGKTGETIKSIWLNSGPKIQVTRNMEAGPNSPTTTVELNGTPEQISSIEKLINDALAEGVGGSNISTQESGDLEPGLEHRHMKTPKDMASPLHLPSGDISTESRAYLVGLREKFEVAKQFIDQILKDDSGDPGIIFAQELGSAEPIAQKFQMKVPNDKVYAIIGKSGETIKHIRLESGAKIQLTKDTDAGPNSPTTVVELNGTSQQISSAQKLINDVLAEGDLGGSDVVSVQESVDMEPDVEHYHMKIPKDMASLLHMPSCDISTGIPTFTHGLQEQMEAVKELINTIPKGGSVDPGTAIAEESSRKEPGAQWFEMKLPNNKVGAIIGESGETIKHIRLQSGARIQFPKDTGADTDSPTTTVELYGTVEQMRSAEKLINDAVAEYSRMVPGADWFEMKLPNKKVGAIIGESGETIKHIQLQSGAKIQFTEDTGADTDSLTTMVELYGTIEQIRSAEKLISEALAEDDSGGSDIGSDSTSPYIPQPPSVDNAHQGTYRGRGAQRGANDGTPAPRVLPGHGHDPQSSSASAPSLLRATHGQPTQPVDGEGEGSTGG